MMAFTTLYCVTKQMLDRMSDDRKEEHECENDDVNNVLRLIPLPQREQALSILLHLIRTRRMLYNICDCSVLYDGCSLPRSNLSEILYFLSKKPVMRHSVLPFVPGVDETIELLSQTGYPLHDLPNQSLLRQ